MPFMKATDIFAPQKSTKVAPDLEEALEEEEDDGEIITEVKDEDDEIDISKDKFIKQPKKKSAAAKKTTGKKVKAATNETDFDEELAEEAKPKISRDRKVKVAVAKGKAKK